MYSYINQQNKVKDRIRQLVNETGQELTARLDIANCLNDYFYSVFTKEDDEMTVQVFQARTGIRCDLNESNFTAHETLQQISIQGRYKSPGPDGIHPFVLKECSQSLSLVLAYIFQRSIQERKFPNLRKDAHISPLFKKGSRINFSNYRPVSLISVPCKLMERIIKKEIIIHLSTKNMLSKFQHGFTLGKSCVTNLLEALDILTESLNRRFRATIIFFSST